MRKKNVNVSQLDLVTAVNMLVTAGRMNNLCSYEMHRAAWSLKRTASNFHRPIQIEKTTGKLFCGGSMWTACSMTVEDINAHDWEVRNVDDTKR